MVWSWAGGKIDTTVTFTLPPAGAAAGAAAADCAEGWRAYRNVFRRWR